MFDVVYFDRNSKSVVEKKERRERARVREKKEEKSRERERRMMNIE